MPDKIIPEFEDFFVSYGSYHHDLTNKLIHIVCIPSITYSLLCMLQFVPWSLIKIDGLFDINASFV